MAARRRDDWDDWDDEPEEKTAAPGLLSTPRILAGLAVIAALALLYGVLVAREPMQQSEVPLQLVGTWTCDDQARSDEWVEFERGWITFGTGGTGTVRHRVIGVSSEAAGGLERFRVRYRDMAGRKHITEFRLDAANGIIRFSDQPQLSWSRYD